MKFHSIQVHCDDPRVSHAQACLASRTNLRISPEMLHGAFSGGSRYTMPPSHSCIDIQTQLWPTKQDTYLSDSPLALASKGESKAALGVAPLLNGDAQQLQVVDGVHVHVCEVGQALPLLLPGVIHLLRVGDYVAHQQPHLHERSCGVDSNKCSDDDDGHRFYQNIFSGWVSTYLISNLTCMSAVVVSPTINTMMLMVIDFTKTYSQGG